MPSAEAALILHRKGFDCSLEAKNLGFNCTTSQGKVGAGCRARPGTLARVAPGLPCSCQARTEAGGDPRLRAPQCSPALPLAQQSWKMWVSCERGSGALHEPCIPLRGGAEPRLDQDVGWHSACGGAPGTGLRCQHRVSLTLLSPSLAGPGQPVPGAGAGLAAAHLADFDVPAGHGLQQHQHPPGPYGNRHLPRPPGVASPGAGEEQTGGAAWEQPLSPAALARPRRGWASGPVASGCWAGGAGLTKAAAF